MQKTKEQVVIEVETVILRALQRKYNWTEDGLLFYVQCFGESLRDMTVNWLEKIGYRGEI